MTPHNDFHLSSLVRNTQIFTKVNSYALDLTFFLTDNLLDLPLFYFGSLFLIETID